MWVERSKASRTILLFASALYRIASKYAEVVAIPKNLCVKIPASTDDESAAFTGIGAIAVHGIRLINRTLNEPITRTSPVAMCPVPGLTELLSLEWHGRRLKFLLGDCECGVDDLMRVAQNKRLHLQFNSIEEESNLFEDFVFDISHVLGGLEQSNISFEDLGKIAERCSFSNLENQESGEEMKESFSSGGQSGDWEYAFKRDLIGVRDNYQARELILLGYESNRHSVEETTA